MSFTVLDRAKEVQVSTPLSEQQKPVGTQMDEKYIYLYHLATKGAFKTALSEAGGCFDAFPLQAPEVDRRRCGSWLQTFSPFLESGGVISSEPDRPAKQATGLAGRLFAEAITSPQVASPHPANRAIAFPTG